jgi:O-antigen/teichoic acid export membrane protein
MASQATISDMGSLARGTAINMVGSGFSIVGRLVYNLLIARILGPSHLGVYFLALTIANVAAVMAMGGLENTTVRFLARHRTDQDWGAFRGTLRFILLAVTSTSLLAVVVLWLTAPWLTSVFFHKPEVATPLRIISTYVPLFVLETVLLSATQSFREMKYKLYVESMLNPALRIAALAVIYKAGGGINAILWSYSVVLGVCAITAFGAVHRCVPADLAAYRPVTDKAALLNYSYPLFGVSILTFLVIYSDSLLLAHFRTNAEVGLYAVCVRLILVTGFALPVVSQIFAPMISELHHRSEIDQLGQYFKVVTLWAVEIFVPLVLVYCVAGREILGFFGPGFSVAAPCLLVLAIGQLANIITGPVGLILNMAGWTRVQLANSAAVLLVQVVAAVLLIPRFGIMGAAVANSAAVIVVNLARVIQLQHRLHVNPFSFALIKPGAAAVAAVMLAWAIRHSSIAPGAIRLGLMCAVMLAAYVSVLLVIGLDHHSRLAWCQLRQSIARVFFRGPAFAGLGKGTE